MYGQGTIRITRRGLTLIELLIAMVVLLVGIYTVAAGFPRMLSAIRGEGDKTAMARICEQTMTRLSDNQFGLPDAITGGGSVAPESRPNDLAAPHLAVNAMQDITQVRGETFRVPAPYNVPSAAGTAGTGSGCYVLAQGPAACPDITAGTPFVYMLVPLTEISDLSAPFDPSIPNWFHVDRATGTITMPDAVTTYDGVETTSWTSSTTAPMVVDYAWATNDTDPEPVVHHVHGEVPGTPNAYAAGGRTGWQSTVYPASLTGGIRLLTNQTKVWARVDIARDPNPADQFPTIPHTYVLDPTYGVRLVFHPADAGLTFKVDYDLPTELTADEQDMITAAVPPLPTPHRALLMIEDVPIETAQTREDGTGTPMGEVRLAVKGVDPAPLFNTDLQGNAMTASVLGVDLQTGATYIDGAGGDFVLSDPSLQPALEDGYNDGIVTYPLTQPFVGHTMRFYYRTLDRHSVQVQKAPRYYVDSDTAATYAPAYRADCDYRIYQLTQAVSPSNNGLELGTIEFVKRLSGTSWVPAQSSSGSTVAVSYSYVPAAQQRRTVWGELHTVPVGGARFTLDTATLAGTPFEILAVNGVSARAKAWWLNRAGLPLTIDVETVFLANPLGIVPRVQ